MTIYTTIWKKRKTAEIKKNNVLMKEFFDNNSYWLLPIYIPLIVGLFSWLGKVWSGRIARKEGEAIQADLQHREYNFNKKLDDMKRDWDKDMRFLTAQLDNSKLVFKLRFEHLYESYLKISEQIHKCRELCVSIMILEIPGVEIAERDSPKPDIRKIRNEFDELSMELQRRLLSNIPFINHEIYTRSIAVVDTMIALVDFERISPLHRDQFAFFQNWHKNKTMENYESIVGDLSQMLNSIGNLMKKDIENHSILNQEKHLDDTVSDKTTSPN